MSCVAPKPEPETLIVVVGGPAPGDSVTAGAAPATPQPSSKYAPANAARESPARSLIDDFSYLQHRSSRRKPGPIHQRDGLVKEAPVLGQQWVPAFAGMTVSEGCLARSEGGDAARS